MLQAVCTTETCTSKTVIYLALCNKCKLQYTQFTLPEFKVHFNLFTPTSHLVILLCCGIIHVVFIYTLNYCISMHWIFDNILSLAYGQVFFFSWNQFEGSIWQQILFKFPESDFLHRVYELRVTNLLRQTFGLISKWRKLIFWLLKQILWKCLHLMS